MQNRADQRKFHYIYKITRNDGSGKYYIGMHSTDDLDDGYFGSGKILAYSIRQHGKEVHSKEILEFLPSRTELKVREKELVNEEIINDPKCMNLKLGGEGGGGFSSKEHQQKCLLAATKFHISLLGTERAKEIAQKAVKTKQQNNSFWRLGNTAKAQLASNSECAMQKRKATFAKRNHQAGETNSQFGTCWVTNGVSIKIKKEQLSEYLLNGYQRGRKYKIC